MILFPLKRSKKLAKHCKSEIAKADPEDIGNTYGIDHLKIGEVKHDSYDLEWLLAQRRIDHMKNKINNDRIIKNECNVLSNLFKFYKASKIKIVITKQYYRGVWKTVAEGKLLEISEFYWTAESFQKILWVSCRQNLNKKYHQK